jgi:hypothetical protein
LPDLGWAGGRFISAGSIPPVSGGILSENMAGISTTEGLGFLFPAFPREARNEAFSQRVQSAIFGKGSETSSNSCREMISKGPSRAESVIPGGSGMTIAARRACSAGWGGSTGPLFSLSPPPQPVAKKHNNIKKIMWFREKTSSPPKMDNHNNQKGSVLSTLNLSINVSAKWAPSFSAIIEV